MSQSDLPSFATSSLFSVEGLVAVVTGGGSGLGLTVAQALDANGAKAVYILGRREQLLNEAAASAKNGRLIPVQCDVTSKESLASVAERVEREHGHLDVLVANAGIVGVATADLLPKGRKPTVQEFQQAMWAPSMDEFTRGLHVNITSVFYTVLAFLHLLDAANKRARPALPGPYKASVIVMSSVSGLSRQLSAGFSYSAAKGGVTHLAKVLATYFADYDIRVNAIAPGIFISEITQGRDYLQNEPTKEGNVDAAHIPMRRVGSPEEIAAAALYLACSAGSYITGNVVVVDGGRLSVQPGSY